MNDEKMSIAKIKRIMIVEENDDINLTFRVIQRGYYAFKIMQFAGQLCMLRMLGFEKEEIGDMFFLDKISDESKLSVIIEANIEA